MSNTVKDEVTPTIIASELRLERQVQELAIVLVEGGNDKKLFERFLADAHCTIRDCQGRAPCLEVNRILSGWDVNGVIVIIDRDFDDHLGQEHPANVFRTEANDIDIEVLQFTLSKILCELASPQKCAAQNIDNETGLAQLFVEASKVGVVRLANAKLGLRAKFRDTEIPFEGASMVVNSEQLVRRVGNAGQMSADESNSLRQEIEELMEQNLPPNQVSNGHDLLRVLGRALRKDWGSDNRFDSRPKGQKLLGAISRIGFEAEHFRTTLLFQKLLEWQDQNPAWTVMET